MLPGPDTEPAPVVPVLAPPTQTDAPEIEVRVSQRRRKTVAAYWEGERIVIVAGSSMGTPGLLNGVLIHTLGGVQPEHLSSGSPAMR